MVKMKSFKTREDWLKVRTSYIGGSDASCVVGMNPYKTNVELWEQKTGRSKPENLDENPFVIYGRDAEEYLRELFKMDFPEYRVDYVENNIWLNDEYPFAHASLDGWIYDELDRFGVLEIKTTNIMQSMQKEKWNKRIPDNYYIQVLHYMMVTGAEFAVLKAQLKCEFDGEVYLATKHYHIERDEVLDDIEYLIQAEKTFYESIKNDTRPSLLLPTI